MPAVDEMSYERARDELVTVVSRLEAGDETLEGSLALWERGEALAARCQQWLDGARARLDAARSVTATSSATTGVAEPDPTPTATDRVPTDQAQPDQAQPDQAQPDQAQPEHTQPDHTPSARDDVDRADNTEDQDA